MAPSGNLLQLPSSLFRPLQVAFRSSYRLGAPSGKLDARASPTPETRAFWSIVRPRGERHRV